MRRAIVPMPSASWWRPVLAELAPPLALYVHWPFCLSKCPYCDFNSHVRDSIDQARWANALVAEIKWAAAETGPRRLTSLFFGGGTPSLMAPATVTAVIDAAAQAWGFADDAEITLEANPTSAEAENFRAYASAGVNRISLGVQALNDQDLSFLGRKHSAEEAQAAITMARSAVDNLSFDLIYARPGQTPEVWEKELAQAIAMGTDHLSLYQLTIESGTEFEKRFRLGRLPVIDDEMAATLFEQTAEVTAAHGLPAYEISNHARAGRESRHNLSYWRMDDYAGIGPGAHGRLTIGQKRFGTVAIRAPEAWLTAVEGQGHGRLEEIPLNRAETADEMIMMGLRLTEGLDLAILKDRTGRTLDEAMLLALEGDGLITRTETRISASPRGRLVLNALIAALV